MKNILLTGGAGYIGSHVAHTLLDDGYKVTIIDNLITGNKELIPRNAKLFVCDISNQKEVKKIITNEKFDLVMHFAGLIRVDESVKEPEKYKEFNYTKAKIFLKTCYEHNLKKIIFSSTASVYGNPSNEKVSEKDQLKPLNPYASSKLELENFIKITSKEFNSKYVILRYFNVAGADPKMRSGLISKVSSHLIKIASEVAIGKRDKKLLKQFNKAIKIANKRGIIQRLSIKWFGYNSSMEGLDYIANLKQTPQIQNKILEITKDEKKIAQKKEKKAKSSETKIVKKPEENKALENYMEDDEPKVTDFIWTEKAINRLELVPKGFMRDNTRNRVMTYALSINAKEITLEVYDAGIHYEERDWSLASRINLWQFGWKVFKDYPLTGCGFKCVDLIHNQYIDPLRL